MIWGIVRRFIFGGGLSALTDQLARAYQAKLEASTQSQKLAADLDARRLENAVAMAQAANADRWSATSIGRYFVVVPFGMWWTAIFLDSIFAFPWDVLALPPAIMEMAVWLIPAIILGDVGRSALARIRPRH